MGARWSVARGWEGRKTPLARAFPPSYLLPTGGRKRFRRRACGLSEAPRGCQCFTPLQVAQVLSIKKRGNLPSVIFVY